MNETMCECNKTGEVYVDHEVGTTSCTCIEGRLRQIEMKYGDRSPLNNSLPERIEELDNLFKSIKAEESLEWKALAQTPEFRIWSKLTDARREIEKEKEALIAAKQYGLVIA